MKGLLDKLFKNMEMDDRIFQYKDVTDAQIYCSLFDRILLNDYRD